MGCALSRVRGSVFISEEPHLVPIEKHTISTRIPFILLSVFISPGGLESSFDTIFLCNMRSYLIGGSCLLLVYVFYYFLSSFLASRRHAQNAARLGCKPPPMRPSKLPFGIDLAQRIMKADRERLVPEMFLELHEEMGRPSTWVQNFLGPEVLVTVDPKNIQALLATQFNDFVIGERRRKNFMPMLGNGIFTADGRAW